MRTSATPPTTRQLLTVSQAAKLLAVHPSTVRRWIRDGQLSGYRPGKDGVRLDLADVLALIGPDKRTRAQKVRKDSHPLTEQEREQGLAVIAVLEALLADDYAHQRRVSDSTEIIHEMRESRTAELMSTSES